MKTSIAILSLILPLAIAESAITEVVVNAEDVITFTHVGPPVEWGVDIVASVIFSSLQVAFENDASRTHKSFAFDSNSGKAYFQSADFTWDDSVDSPWYWYWPDQGLVNGAQHGTNYLVLDVDDNGYFETLIEIQIPENAAPPGVNNANWSINIVRYLYDLNANSTNGTLSPIELLSFTEGPSIELITKSTGDLQIEFSGTLQRSDLLSGWESLNPQPTSPFIIKKEDIGQRMFYKAIE